MLVSEGRRGKGEKEATESVEFEDKQATWSSLSNSTCVLKLQAMRSFEGLNLGARKASEKKHEWLED